MNRRLANEGGLCFLFVFHRNIESFWNFIFSIFKRLGLQSSPSSDLLELRLLGGKQDMETALFFVFLFKTWLVSVFLFFIPNLDWHYLRDWQRHSSSFHAVASCRVMDHRRPSRPCWSCAIPMKAAWPFQVLWIFGGRRLDATLAAIG